MNVKNQIPNGQFTDYIIKFLIEKNSKKSAENLENDKELASMSTMVQGPRLQRQIQLDFL